jgi:hypothetical protein
MTRFSEHFTREELTCPTSGKLILAPGFIDALESLRVSYGHPMAVTSGCRSSEHNDWLKSRGYKASPNSFHLIGNEKYGTDTCAVDVRRPGGDDLWRLVKVAQAEGWSVGIAKTFIHLDMRAKFTDLPPVIYSY